MNYLLGDTTLSIDHIKEKVNKKLVAIVVHCANDFNVAILPEDVERAERIGPYFFGRKRPWPVKGIFREFSETRDQLFYYKSSATTIRYIHVPSELTGGT